MESWESMIEKIMDILSKAANLETITIGKDMEVEGRTDTYTVDWYWEFRAANGVIYKVVASARNVEKTLAKNEMVAFASMVQDISGQVLGVIFTQPVYDKMIHDIAKDVGILLYEMAAINDKPNIAPLMSRLKLAVDEKWVAEQKAKAGIGDEKIPFTGSPEYMYLYDGNDMCLDTVGGIINTYVKKHINETDELHDIVHDFAEPLYLHTGNALLPRVKLNGISFCLGYKLTSAWSAADIVEKIVNSAMQRYLN